MQQNKIYPLQNIQKRKKNNFIILSHIRNFSIRNDPMKPDMKGYRPYFTTNYMRDYFARRTQRSNIPFHYHVNEMMGDWEVLNTAPLDAKSDMLQKAYEFGYIDQFFKDGIVIGIQDEYDTRVPDLRTFEVIGFNIISPLLKLLRLSNFNTSIYWLDEIFDYDRYQQDLLTPRLNIDYPYEFRPMRYYDKVQFNLETKRFI